MQAPNSNNTSNNSKDNIFILDATAFYAGVPFISGYNNELVRYDYYTTPRVIEEIKHIKHRLDAVNILVRIQNIKVIEPNNEYTVKAKEYARIYGEYGLSNTDISIIALALMLKEKQYMNNIIIVSDDFSIANIARAIGIGVAFIASKGIKQIIKWVRYCKICKIDYHERLRVCKICGNGLRKRRVAVKQNE